jgi:uncharacterized membrane protein YphA (DoxX/SURF4 family)
MTKIKQIYIQAAAYSIIVLFTYAASSKLLAYDEFVAQIGKSPLIMSHSSWLAWLVPSIEIAISICLLIPRFQVLSFYASYMLMSIFTFYIAFILTFSPYVPCSCGGILDKMGWTEHLLFNIVFMGIAGSGALLINTDKQHASSSDYQLANS